MTTRFLPRIDQQLRFVLAHPFPPHLPYTDDLREVYRALLARLEDTFTKRILFSTRQAGLFSGIGQPPTEIQRRLRLPFEQFYLELDDDLELIQPRRDSTFLLRAFFVVQIDGMTLSDHEGHTVLDITQFGRTSNLPDWIIDIGWWMCLPCGTGYAPVVNVRDDPTTGLTVPPDVPDDYLVAAPHDAPDGALYDIAQGTALLSYLLAYLTAKSITIQAEPVSRQQRRWLQAHGRTPQPWHVVKLEPRIATQPPPEDEPLHHHSFRYDVIGHLRFNRHRLADGSYRPTVEWVPAHQRGLDHVEYIPKTYRVDHGKRIHPLMRQYYSSTLQGPLT